jgi:hypothetical protein
MCELMCGCGWAALTRNVVWGFHGHVAPMFKIKQHITLIRCRREGHSDMIHILLLAPSVVSQLNQFKGVVVTSVFRSMVG